MDRMPPSHSYSGYSFTHTKSNKTSKDFHVIGHMMAWLKEHTAGLKFHPLHYISEVVHSWTKR